MMKEEIIKVALRLEEAAKSNLEQFGELMPIVFLISKMNDKIRQHPVIGIEELFRSKAYQAHLRKVVLEAARTFNKVKLDYEEKIVAVVFITEGFFYSKPANDKSKDILPSQHPDKKEGLITTIHFSSSLIVQMRSFLRVGKKFIYDPATQAEDGNAIGAVSNLFPYGEAVGFI